MIVPHDIPHVEAGGETMGKTGVGVSEFRHLGLEFPVGHTCGIAVDDAEVGLGNFFCWGIAVGRRCIEHEASTGGVPLLGLVIFLCVLLLDVVELLVMDFILVLRFLGSASDSSCEGPKDVGGVRRRGRKGGRCFDAWHDVGAVEAGIPIVKFAIVWGNKESCLGYLSLVNSQTPEGENFEVGIDVLFAEILIFVVGVHELFSSCSAHEDEGKWGEGVRCEDRIAKERSKKETIESFKVDDACGVISGEGGQVIDCEASVYVLDGGDNLLDRE